MTSCRMTAFAGSFPRPRSTALARLLVILGLALLAGLPAGVARAAPSFPEGVPPNWIGGSFSTDRTLTVAAPGPDYVVYGDIVVEPGATLTIESGVTVSFIDNSDFFASGGYVNRCEITVHGALVAIGVPGDSVVFRSQSGNGNAWGEIRVQSGGRADLSHVRIDGGSSGLVVSIGALPSSLRHSTVGGSSLGVNSTSTLEIRSCVISGGFAGIQAYLGDVLVEDTEVRGGQYGMRLSGARVKRCVVRGASLVGILPIGPNVSFQPDDSTNVTATEVFECPTGILIDELSSAEGPYELRNLLVHNCTDAGIVIARTPGVTINYCTVANVGVGVRSLNSASNPRILNSIIAFANTVLELQTGTVDYTDLWGGIGGLPGTWGPQIAVFDPYFVNPVDYHLAPNSLFTDYSVSGGQIGAYGPGTLAPLDVDPAFTRLPELRVLSNPSRNGFLSVQFGGSATGTARVRVLDLAGRELSRHVVDLAPGRRFDPGPGRPLPSGMYFVAVEHGGRITLAKASVVR